MQRQEVSRCRTSNTQSTRLISSVRRGTPQDQPGNPSEIRSTVNGTGSPTGTYRRWIPEQRLHFLCEWNAPSSVQPYRKASPIQLRHWSATCDQSPGGSRLGESPRSRTVCSSVGPPPPGFGHRSASPECLSEVGCWAAAEPL